MLKVQSISVTDFDEVPDKSNASTSLACANREIAGRP
jgi:hypothetical protein